MATNVRTPRINVGRERTAVARNHSSSVDAIAALKDRNERLQQENQALKHQRNDLETKLKELKTQFRRLTRDLRAGGTDVDALLNESVDKHNHPPQGVLASRLAAISAQRDQLHNELQEAKSLLRIRNLPARSDNHLQPHDVNQMHQLRGGAEGAANSELLKALNEVDHLRREVQRLRDENTNLLTENDRLRHTGGGEGSLYATSPSRQGRHSPARNHNHQHQQTSMNAGLPAPVDSANDAILQAKLKADEAELQRMREKLMSNAIEIDALSRERDMLKIQAQHGDPAKSAIDPQTMLELQRGIAEKTSQVAALTSKFQFAQSQVTTLQAECNRLVGEMQQIHAQNADARRNVFELEHSKFELQAKADRAGDFERLLQLKTEELMKSEQECLRLVDRLAMATREVEAQVRSEHEVRISDLDRMREQAESERREKERANFQLTQENTELKRANRAHDEDMTMLRREIERLQNEKQEMQSRNALLGSKGMDVDDDVHRAVALVNVKKQQKDAMSPQALWEGLEWNEGWELSKMRDALAQAALDSELADTRCKQLQDDSNSRTQLLDDISKERDELLDENIELRQRISGIQTMLLKRTLASRDSSVDANDAPATVEVRVHGIRCDTEIARLDDGTMYTPTLFITFDGFDGFETLVSDNFYTLDGALNIVFRFEDVPLSSASPAELRNTNFTFQLHQSHGTVNTIVASGSIPGAHLLRCRDGSRLSNNVDLVDGEGVTIGQIETGINMSTFFLPMLLRDPDPTEGLSQDRIRAALLAFRHIRGLRVEIFSASGLKSDPNEPMPYVFYTASSEEGALNFIADSTVHPTNRAVTPDPTFDALPVEHPVVIDREFVRFVFSATITFVVFDNRAKDFETNLGVASIPLRKLLDSPAATIVTTEALHPQGELKIGLAWAR